MKCLPKSFLILSTALVFIFNDCLSQVISENSALSTSVVSDLAEWYKPLLQKEKTKKLTDYSIPSKEVVARKISKMNLSIAINFDEEVYKHITYILGEGREDFEVALGLLNCFSQKIEQELKRFAIPNEFKYLPIALTGIHNEFISEQGAGVWRLNYIMARRYGLEISEYIDERKNIALSSNAAATLLNYYYTKYKNWELAISATFGSAALVNKAIQRSDGETDYYKISHHFTDEVKNIYPVFLAIFYVAENYRQLGLMASDIKIDSMPEATVLKKKVTFTEVSNLLNIHEHRLRMINPTFRSSVVPTSTNQRKFYLPKGYGTSFSQMEDSIYSLAMQKMAPIKIAHKKPIIIPEGSVKVIHEVVSGDNLGAIAKHYNVYISQLKSWNVLNSDLINIGQKLAVYVSKSKAFNYKTQYSKTKNVNLSSEEKSTLVLYTVQAGDTLWSIANRHPGNSIEEIQKINGINANLKPGQIVKIKKILTH